MNIGDKVRIENSGSIFDGKDGIIETLDEENNVATIYVDFIPSEDKRVRQNFPLNCILNTTQENSISESKKSKEMPKNGLKIENRFDTSSLSSLQNALGENSMSLLSNYPYSFQLLVSVKFVNSYNYLRKTTLSDNKSATKLLKIFDRAFARLSDRGIFDGVDCEKVNGLPNKYDGNIMELKVGEVNGKPIRILYFTLPNKIMVLGNIFYHKGESLTDRERNSINDVYDKVKNI